MSGTEEVASEEVDALYSRLNAEAEKSGYHLNPDPSFTRELIKGLIVNERRYGYMACPCRLASGKKRDDLDMICPCDYRDPDLDEFGTCYCCLYLTRAMIEGGSEPSSIPERRPAPGSRKPEGEMEKEKAGEAGPPGARLPVWRCKVCGYLCARENPPEVCPICKAGRERFERFM
ncbi:MAG: ferredoxin:glutaredoxin reductase [Candidatus Krumholzibacteria bacterium]|jgi:ferredoxin-thioredoxin reductase catalytic subunit|nr:ferredoxin:glutaredoxin reductase [Candidatus Krumholzibacteria bacterium]